MKKIFLILIFLFFTIIKADAQKINVAYATDNNYVIYTLISINSIIKNNTSNSDYTFYIFENGISNQNKKLMKDYIENLGQNVEFIYINPIELDKRNRLYKSRVPSIALSRIIMPLKLPPDAKRMIYIDGDTIITGDFKDFYNLELSGRPLGMVKDFDANIHKPKMSNEIEEYYNGGIMLIDIEKWKNENITEILKYDLDKNYEQYVKWGLADQDLLNYALKNRIKTLPQYWNNQCWQGKKLDSGGNLGMNHYIVDKPWKKPFLSVKDQNHRLYFGYWNKSGLRKYKYRDYFKIIKNNLYIHKIFKIINSAKQNRYFPKDWLYTIF